MCGLRRKYVCKCVRIPKQFFFVWVCLPIAWICGDETCGQRVLWASKCVCANAWLLRANLFVQQFKLCVPSGLRDTRRHARQLSTASTLFCSIIDSWVLHIFNLPSHDSHSLRACVCMCVFDIFFVRFDWHKTSTSNAVGILKVLFVKFLFFGRNKICGEAPLFEAQTLSRCVCVFFVECGKKVRNPERKQRFYSFNFFFSSAFWCEYVSCTLKSINEHRDMYVYCGSFIHFWFFWWSCGIYAPSHQHPAQPFHHLLLLPFAGEQREWKRGRNRCRRKNAESENILTWPRMRKVMLSARGIFNV